MTAPGAMIMQKKAGSTARLENEQCCSGSPLTTFAHCSPHGQYPPVCSLPCPIHCNYLKRNPLFFSYFKLNTCTPTLLETYLFWFGEGLFLTRKPVKLDRTQQARTRNLHISCESKELVRMLKYGVQKIARHAADLFRGSAVLEHP